MVSSGILDGIGKALYGLTGYRVYIDYKKQKTVFPCFLIKTIEETQEHIVGDRYSREYLFDIRLFLNEHGEVSDIRALKTTAEAMFMSLEYITLPDKSLLLGEDMHYRVTDGVLHFFVTYNAFILKVREKSELMQTLITEGSLKNDE